LYNLGANSSRLSRFIWARIEDSEYMCHFESKYGNVVGAGWFSSGTVANLSVAPVVDFTSGTRVVFVRWILPANVSHSEKVASVRMDAPKKVQVIWNRQFLLTVRSDVGSPKGGGWYDEGSVAVFSVDWAVVQILIIQMFQEWVGDVNASSPTASVLMNSPKEVTALWRTDYTRTYAVGGCGLAMALFGGFIAWRIRKTRRMRPRPRRRVELS